ncbi:MAG TPA: hypothetical protein VHP33_11270 [Polyangiaceae bacterium]|nr:hypothetical protein [Polyangiaceae bacterium]
MSRETVLGEDDFDFEQLLLGAGRTETLSPEQTEAALLRFAAGVAALQGAAVAGAAVGATAATAVARPWARLFVTTKWLALGFVAGGITTFAWLRQTAPVPTAPSAASAPITTAATAVAPPVQPVAASSAEPKPVGAASLATEPTPRSGRAANTAPRVTVKSAPDLAAEVMALDSIRTALSIGALRDAEQRVADYRRKFAQGSLRSEAEVLAIEVLVAQGRTQAAAAAAERFISQHPRDPQVARVRALVE